mmetsp:Transcript_2469/g.4521  ORF Transcript_2469/g.4521 Transcript_2469/m.4521 type:complete len:85 (-) Transcript_2469:75-329(-)
MLSTLLDIHALTQNALIAAPILIQSLALSFNVKMHLIPTVSRPFPGQDTAGFRNAVFCAPPTYFLICPCQIENGAGKLCHGYGD